MTTLNKQFVPYTLALKLKQLGFDEPCMAVIDQTEYTHIKGTKYPIRGAMVYNEIDCPLWQQAFEWFREKHGIWICVDKAEDFNWWKFNIRKLNDIGYERIGFGSDFNSPKEAYEAAIEYTLKNLI